MRLPVVLLSVVLGAAVVAAAGRPHVYLVVIDGLDYDAVTPAEMPRLTDAALCGPAIGEGRAIMPTRTNPNHVSLLTGALAEGHGITGNAYWDRATRSAKPLDAAALIEMETLFTVAAASRPAPVTVAAFSKARIGRLFATVPERQRAPDVLWVPEAEAAGHVVGVATDGETMDAFLAATASREPHLAAINLSEVDRVAHERGPDATAEARRHADAALGRLIEDLRRRGRWERSVLIVTADHGFNDVAPRPGREAPVIVLAERFAAEGVAGIQVVSDGGMAHVYADALGAEATRAGDAATVLGWAAALAWREPGVAEVVARLPIPGIARLADAHPDWGLDHERAGDLLVVARPGFHLVDPTDEIGRQFRGNHGSPHEMRVPLVIAGGALARPACPHDAPPSHADVGATIAALLGLRAPRRFDGRPIRVGRALALPLRAEAQRPH